MAPEEPADRPRYGLCADCEFARRIQTTRGSEFLMCERSQTDPDYPRYPRLPVLRCPGYRAAPLH